MRHSLALGVVEALELSLSAIPGSIEAGSAVPGARRDDAYSLRASQKTSYCVSRGRPALPLPRNVFVRVIPSEA
jgi:hypothetical protein